MENSIVYHGSNVEVSIPRILQNGFYKDFGYGFYCTSYEKQAKRWAMTKKGASSFLVTPSTLTLPSSMTSRSADCVLGEVRFISSARKILVKIAPGR